MMNVAHIGGGYWGKNVVQNFAQPGGLKAIVDANPDQAAKLLSEYGAETKSFDTVLADSSIGAVSFAAPAELHVPLHQQTAYRNAFCDPASLAASEAAAKRVFNLSKHSYVDKINTNKTIYSLGA